MRNLTEYIVMIVSEFAKRYALSAKQAFHYIHHFGGIQLIEENYNIMHTLTFEDAVEGVASYCHRNGGQLA